MPVNFPVCKWLPKLAGSAGNSSIMKKISIAIIMFLCCANCFSQDWTDEQLGQADTGRDIDKLSETEKDAIMYINLARLFPAEFVTIELESYTGPEGNENALTNSAYKITDHTAHEQQTGRCINVR